LRLFIAPQAALVAYFDPLVNRDSNRGDNKVIRRNPKNPVDISLPAATIFVSALPRREDVALNEKSDSELVQAAADGDKNAYGLLYDRYAPLVRAICYDHTRHLTDAQDLAQDVFLRAYERLGSLRKPEGFGRWLVGIARLRCREWQRQKHRERPRQQAIQEAILSGRTSPGNGEVEQLRRQVARLPEKERLALHAFYLREHSAEEARRTLGLSRSGFYRVLERGRKRLERLMARRQEDIR
jgi:RNA polymerase sigma-70 factor (ECF subfamily)